MFVLYFRSAVNPRDASAHSLVDTLSLPSGVGASCVVRDIHSWQVNGTRWEFDPACGWLFDIGGDYSREMWGDRRGGQDFDVCLDPLG